MADGCSRIDDLVLLANNEKDMQLQLNALNEFVKSVKLKVNLGKTKIMIVKQHKSCGYTKNSMEEHMRISYYFFSFPRVLPLTAQSPTSKVGIESSSV